MISALRTQKYKDALFLQLMSNLDWIIKYSDELVEQFDRVVTEYRDERKNPVLSIIFTEPWQVSMEQTLTSFCTSYPKTIANLDKFIKENSMLTDYFQVFY